MTVGESPPTGNPAKDIDPMQVEDITRLDLHGVEPGQFLKTALALVARIRSFARLQRWFAQLEAMGPYAPMKLVNAIVIRKRQLSKPRDTVLAETLAVANRGGPARNPFHEQEAFWRSEEWRRRYLEKRPD